MLLIRLTTDTTEISKMTESEVQAEAIMQRRLKLVWEQVADQQAKTSKVHQKETSSKA